LKTNGLTLFGKTKPNPRLTLNARPVGAGSRKPLAEEGVARAAPIPDKRASHTAWLRLVFEVAVENAFDFRSAQYAALYDASAATAFQQPLWLDGLYGKLLGVNNALPLIIVVRRTADKSLAMVLPLVRRRYGILRVVEFADLRVTDYASAVVDRRSFEAILADANACRAIRRAVKPYDLLRIAKQSDEALPMHRLFGIDQPGLMPTHSYAVPLGSPFEEWRKQYLNASYGRELDKKLRQINRKGEFRFEQVNGEAELGQAFDALKIFRHDRFEVNGGGELLQIPTYFDFYSALALSSESTRTYVLSMDGKTIAVAFGLVRDGAFLLVLVGFTQKEYKSYSVGSLMTQELARDCVTRGGRLLDFTIGDEPYKMTFGAKPMPMWQTLKAGTPLGYAANIAVQKLPAAKALARKFIRRTSRVNTAPAAPLPTGSEAIET
jgi:CelD/BcsL family acetyltransferase involved in cellulose biosynthesis